MVKLMEVDDSERCDGRGDKSAARLVKRTDPCHICGRLIDQNRTTCISLGGHVIWSFILSSSFHSEMFGACYSSPGQPTLVTNIIS